MNKVFKFSIFKRFNFDSYKSLVFQSSSDFLTRFPLPVGFHQENTLINVFPEIALKN